MYIYCIDAVRQLSVVVKLNVHIRNQKIRKDQTITNSKQYISSQSEEG